MQDGTDRLNMKLTQHLFPKLKKREDYAKLKIDEESLHYISTKEVANKITEIIYYHLIQMKIDPKEAVITDANAGVGGDTISFARKFFFVNAIEMDGLRSGYLKNNIDVYRLPNVNVINDDCLKFLGELEHNVVFFDPPWGGKDYKNHRLLRLSLSGIQLPEIVNDLMANPDRPSSPELIVIKIPKNFDLHNLFRTAKSSALHLYQLKKMDIVVIENSKKHQILSLETEIKKNHD